MDLRLDLNETTFELQRAILIYSEGGYTSRRTLATVHNVQTGGEAGGQPRVAAGRPITTGDLREITRKLGRKPQTARFLPERVVASTPSCLIWHKRIGREPIYFESKSEELNDLSGTALPHPPLIFCLRRRRRGSGGSMHVWAKRRRGRPDEDTILYHAPFFNVNSRGGVCHGSMRTPGGFGPGYTRGWEQAFFQSAFTHGSGVAFLNGQPGYTDTLTRLAKSGDRFPTERLKRTGERLRDAIASS